ETESPSASGCRPPLVAVEYRHPLVVGHAEAMVRDRDDRLAVIPMDVEHDLFAPAELAGIVDEVAHDLLYSNAVEAPDESVVAHQQKPGSCRGRERFERVSGVGNDLHEIHVGALDRALRQTDFPGVEKS